MRLRVRVAALALAVALAAASLVASNMGYLVWRNLPAATPGISVAGFNTLALPYQRDAELLTAGDLMTDIGFANVGNVQRFVEATSTFEIYTGRKGSPGPNFPLASGECYFLKMNVTTDYLIGGSSVPGLALALDGPGPANPTGINFVALPYHSIATNAAQLIADIGLANVANVQNYLAATDTFQVYTGRKGSPSPPFPLVRTQCYFVKMNAPVAYVPSHY